jgi:CheY-like chemotaxis protein
VIGMNAARLAHPVVEPVGARAVDAASPRVLVIDDEADLREMVRHMLLTCGCTVLTAPDGVAALRLLARLSDNSEAGPDLIITDLQMPVLDGAGFIQAYRLLPGSQAPIVLMTAAPDRASTVAHLADDVLIKPFSIGALLEVAGRYLRKVTT